MRRVSFSFSHTRASERTLSVASLGDFSLHNDLSIATDIAPDTENLPNLLSREFRPHAPRYSAKHGKRASGNPGIIVVVVVIVVLVFVNDIVMRDLVVC